MTTSAEPARDVRAGAASDATPYPARAAAWWAVAVFALAGLVAYTDRAVLSAIVDPMRRDLGISDTQVSLLQGAAFALVYVFAGLPFGRVADRAHRMRLIIAGVTVWCAGTVACGLAPGFSTLLGARVIVGIGEASLFPAAVSVISDSFPPQLRGAAVGIALAGVIVGGSAAAAIGGIVLGAAQHGAFANWPVIAGLAPWRTVLVLVGAGGLIVPLLCTTIREPVRREVSSERGASLRDVVALLASQRRFLVPLYIGMGLLSIGDYAVQLWGPSVLLRRFLFDPASMGAWFGGVTAIGGVLGAVIGGPASDVAQRRGGSSGRLAAIAGGAAVAAAGALLISAPVAGLALGGSGLWMFASTLAATAGITALGVVVPNDARGVSISLVAFCNTLLGLGIGPTIVALATEHVYHDPVAVGFAITTTVLPAALIATTLFARTSRVLRAGAVP
jgi:MFS family permease